MVTLSWVFISSLFFFLSSATAGDAALAAGVSYGTECQQLTPEESALTAKSLRKSPALLVENKGQWADSSVRFAMQRPGANILIYDDALAIQLLKRNDGCLQSATIKTRFIGANKV